MLCVKMWKEGAGEEERICVSCKVFLKPGEVREVEFAIERKEFVFYGEEMEPVDGKVPLRITVGNSSCNEAGSVEFTVGE